MAYRGYTILGYSEAAIKGGIKYVWNDVTVSCVMNEPSFIFQAARKKAGGVEPFKVFPRPD